MTAVCIAGMHRSGTSMVARMLNLCGVYLGEEKDLVPFAADNPEGFWENVHFVEVNENVLSALKGSWDIPPNVEFGWENAALLDSCRMDAERLVREMENHAPWGWKDPRNSLTVPFWKKLIPGIKVVVCLRNPQEVIRSMARRAYSSTMFSARLLYEYNQRLLAAVPTQDCIITHYEAFLYDAAPELRRLLSFLQLPQEEQKIDTAITVVNSTLRHSRSTFADLADLNEYPEVVEMYSRMCAQAGPVFQSSLSEQTSGITPEHAEQSASSPMNQWGNSEPLVQSLQNQVKTLEQKVQVLAVKVDEKEHVIRALTEQISEKEQAVQTLTNIYRQEYIDSKKNNQKTKQDAYVPIAETDYDSQNAAVKAIAFYLPQYHPIPENDAWWGKGFTEWTNVSKAVPNFVGHYQPRLPGELGFYDLRIPEVQKRQVELARKYGIYGFCFHYYWFSGKRLLERPLDQFLKNPEIDFPFCICWANENWTRRWDGAEDEILIGQTHSEEEYAAFIRDVIPIFLDDRYIRVNGKPLLIVYRVSWLPDPQHAAEIWRSECKKRGMDDIYLVAAQSYQIGDPRLFGFDAAVEFPPHNLGHTYIDKNLVQIINPYFTGGIFDYEKAVQCMIDARVPDYTLFKTVMPSWDNTARRQNDGFTFIHSTPEAYKRWVKYAIDHTQRFLPKDKQFIFINSWNEWGEAAYLEPDRFYGYAYLQATAEAVAPHPKE